MVLENSAPFGHLDTIIEFSGISFEKICTEIDPGNRENGVQVPGNSGMFLRWNSKLLNKNKTNNGWFGECQ